MAWTPRERDLIEIGIIELLSFDPLLGRRSAYEPPEPRAQPLAQTQSTQLAATRLVG